VQGITHGLPDGAAVYWDLLLPEGLSAEWASSSMKGSRGLMIGAGLITAGERIRFEWIRERLPGSCEA